MATSGTYSWSLNRDQTILMAFQELNVYGTRDTINTVSDGDQLIAQNTLNGMLKMWSIDGIKATKRLKGYLFPQLNQYEYTIGSVTGSDNCTLSYKSTTITTDAATSTSTLVVASTTGMTAADKIGIELDDGTRQWTTIVSVDSSTGLTITTPLTDSASIDNTVITYTAKLNRPLDILYGTNLDITTGLESSMQWISHDQYFTLPVKNTPGKPNNAYYNKPMSGAIPHNSKVYLFPQPQNVNEIITFVYVDSIQDMSSSTDDTDLPQEWQFPVMFNLAALLAQPYGKFTELERIQPIADKMYEMVKASAADNTDIQFSVGDGC